jgi:hypothetical protein
MRDKRTPEQAHSEGFRAGYQTAKEEMAEDAAKKGKKGGGKPKLTLEDIARMGTDEINERWEEVSAAMERGA